MQVNLLKGNLSTPDSLSGSLSTVPSLSGTLNDVAQLFGTLSVVDTLHGSLSEIAGLSGSLTIPKVIGGNTYDGSYVVVPKAYSDQVLETQYRVMTDDVTVLKVPYYQTSNLTGDTVYIASEV